MTYSIKVKSEIIRSVIPNEQEIYAEITAIFRMSGSYVKSGADICFEVLTENPAFARRIFSLVKSAHKITSDIRIIKNRRFGQHNEYVIKINNGDVLRDITENMEIGFLNGANCFFILPEFITENDEAKKAYIRGAFLAAGSISNPEKTYHLEIKARDRLLAEELSKLLGYFELRPRILDRNRSYTVYLKESDNIKEFLAITGAHELMMEFENIRILKEMRNTVNRLVNCETSNLDRTVDAGMRQIDDIRLIESTTGLSALLPSLREIAYLRLQNEGSSLSELSELTGGRIGKSGVSHRLRKITKIAALIREKEIEKDIDKKD